MALFHRATLAPTKAEAIAMWVPTRSWGPSAADPIDVIGSYRFDDPEGRVGMETHLVKAGGALLQVPLTYRDEPLDGAEGRSTRTPIGTLSAESRFTALGRGTGSTSGSRTASLLRLARFAGEI